MHYILFALAFQYIVEEICIRKEEKSRRTLLTPIVLSEQLHSHNGEYEDNDTKYEG